MCLSTALQVWVNWNSNLCTCAEIFWYKGSVHFQYIRVFKLFVAWILHEPMLILADNTTKGNGIVTLWFSWMITYLIDHDTEVHVCTISLFHLIWILKIYMEKLIVLLTPKLIVLNIYSVVFGSMYTVKVK